MQIILGIFYLFIFVEVAALGILLPYHHTGIVAGKRSGCVILFLYHLLFFNWVAVQISTAGTAFAEYTTLPGTKYQTQQHVAVLKCAVAVSCDQFFAACLFLFLLQ